jgi:hypothetical protein
LVDQR